MARAIVVLCPNRPDAIFGQPLLGHVGWGYELPDGSWSIGAVEGTAWHPGNANGFWAKRVCNLNDAVGVFANMKNDNAEYNYYKVLTVTGVNPNPVFADEMMQWVSQQPYNLIGRNCMDDVYDILRAFSQGNFNNAILPSPKDHWIPNDWFNNIVTDEFYYLPGVAALSERVIESTPVVFDSARRVDTPAWRQKGHPDYIDTSNRKCDDNTDTSVSKPGMESPHVEAEVLAPD